MKEEIQKEIDRLKELLTFYEEIPTGFFGASIIKNSIKSAELLLMNGNWVESEGKRMLKDLKEITG